MVAGYFGLLALSGVFLSRRSKSTREYFQSGGRIPWWAAGASLLATALSAATFIGAPQQSYRGDLTYLVANVGSIIAIVVVALYFIPIYYRYGTPTVYGIIGIRFGEKARRWASGVYLSGRVFASGARIYIAALPFSLILFGHTELNALVFSIALLTLIGIFYTWIGGIKAVVWSDILQLFIFTGAAVAALVALFSLIPADFHTILEALHHPGPHQASKLTILNWVGKGWGPDQTYTLVTALTGFLILNLGAYGADQDLAQRLLACRGSLEGAKAAIGGIVMGLPVTALFMGVGLLLWVFYQRPDIMGSAYPASQPPSREVFLRFILDWMPAGMKGLMISGLFAAALSTLNSGINAMASSLMFDFYRPLRSGLSESHYLKVSMVMVVIVGLVLGLVAGICALWQHLRPQTTLIDFALSLMTFAYSGLTAVYLTALFTRRGNSKSAIGALMIGWVSVLVMQIFFYERIAFPWQLTIGFLLAMGCVLAGRPEKSPSTPPPG